MAVYKHPTAGEIQITRILERDLNSHGQPAGPNAGYLRVMLKGDDSHKYVVKETRVTE